MRHLTSVIGAGLLAAMLSGCRDNTPPPPRVPVPTSDNPHARRETDPIKPLPPARREARQAPAPFYDEPLVSQRPPEQRRFVDAYNAVGRPRITLFVNRTLEGQIIPVNPGGPIASVEQVRRSTTGVSVEDRASYSRYDRRSDREAERVSSFESTGPGEYRETTEVYLRPGQYDEVNAKSLDYEAMEAIMTDWISASGQVTLVDPSMTRQKLTDEQIKDLQSGRPQVLREIAEQLDADVLIQVQAHPTRQTREGLEVRVIAAAMNVRGGESLGRAVVDIPPPLEKTQLNQYTRFLARKLMDDLTNAWTAPAPEPRQAPTTRP